MTVYTRLIMHMECAQLICVLSDEYSNLICSTCNLNLYQLTHFDFNFIIRLFLFVVFIVSVLGLLPVILTVDVTSYLTSLGL